MAADWSQLPWQRFLGWAFNSVRLGAISAVVAVAVALALLSTVGCDTRLVEAEHTGTTAEALTKTATYQRGMAMRREDTKN
ncbi:MAG: hypothetical protein WCG92_15200 [Hyphomicrobiales bacterium]